jgi:hypothetical protein
MAWDGEMRFDEAGHPLWVLLAHPFTLIPGVDPAYGGNLLSAILSALALWPAFRIMRRLGASETASSIACLALAVSHTYWFHATITEVYALNSLVMLALLDVATSALGEAPGEAVRAPSDVALFSVGLACALGGANHNLVYLWVPGLLWFLVAACRAGRLRAGGLVAAAAGFALGFAPYLWLRSGVGRGETVVALAERLLGGILQPAGKIGDAARFGAYLFYQFPVPVILVAAVVGLRRVPLAPRVGLGLIYICSAGFAFSYPVQDRFAFYLPSYLVVALFAAPGIDALLARASAVKNRGVPVESSPPGIHLHRFAVASLFIVAVAVPPIVYRLAPLAASAIPEVRGVRAIPGRDAALYHLYPGKRGDDGARRFCEEAFSVLPPRALLIADDTLAEPLDYLQVVERVRTDVEVMYVSPARQLQVAISKTRLGRPVFLAACDAYYNVADLGRWFEIVPEGPIYRLAPRPRSSS